MEIGEILFYSAFIAPIFINISVMKYLKYKMWVKFIIGFVISIIVIAILLFASIYSIKGLGPS
jgi:hypothetical protein